MNWKKMIVIGALACGAAGLVAGCGGEKKAAAPAADNRQSRQNLWQGWMILSRRWDSVMTKVKSVGFDIDMAKAVPKNRDTH